MSGGALAISAGPDLGVTMAPDRQVHGNGGRVQSGCRFPSASRDESKVCRVGPGTAHAPTENEQRKMENADRRHWRQVMSSYQQPAPEAAEGEWWTYMEEASPSTLAWLSILHSHGCPFAEFRLKIVKMGRCTTSSPNTQLLCKSEQAPWYTTSRSERQCFGS